MEDETPIEQSNTLDGGAKSILTFNASVSDKNIVSVIEEPFQCMPSTRNYLTDASIQAYPKSNNTNLLVHMNYITRPFGDNAIESNSRVRYSLRQYQKLIAHIGTNDVLIHMPSNPIELRNLAQGLSVINDELCNHGITVHLEIACWSLDLVRALKVNQSNAIDVVGKFVDAVLTACKRYQGKFYIVFDTAHLLANGCTADMQIMLFDKYRKYMKYVHLNGNINGMFTSDSHVPIWHGKSKLVNYENMAKHIASMGLICIAEVTKAGDNYDKWKAFSDEMGFNLVKFHPAYSL